VTPGRAHITVFRREDVLSSGASWDRCPYGMCCSPILTIVPLIIRRFRASVTGPASSLPHDRAQCPSVPRRRFTLQPRPHEARQLARDRDHDFGARLMFGRHFSKPSAQPLLRLVSDQGGSRSLSWPSAPERPEARLAVCQFRLLANNVLRGAFVSHTCSMRFASAINSN